jgi:hypothetical protein
MLQHFWVNYSLTRLKITSVITCVHKLELNCRPSKSMQYCMHACRPTAVKQLANFSARLVGKAAGQGCIARVHVMVQYAKVGVFLV